MTYANNRYQPQSAAVDFDSFSDRELCAYAAALINTRVVIIGSISREAEVEDAMADVVLREGHALTESGRSRLRGYLKAKLERLRYLMKGDVATDLRHNVHPLPSRPLLVELGLTIVPAKEGSP